MGTEILRPRDLLIRSAPDLFPPRRFSPIHHHKHKPLRKPPAVEERRRRRRQSEGSPKTSKHQGHERPLEMGRVTILKRGQSLGTAPEGAGGAGDGTTSVDPPFGAGRLGPDPEAMPKQIRLVPCPEDGYAGSEFSMSPSPRSLPLPSFSRKGVAEEDATATAAVDRSATAGLLRLLRLE